VNVVVQVAVWRGDITTLRVDGIVNAANEYMLYDHAYTLSRAHARTQALTERGCVPRVQWLLHAEPSVH
jgi:O-acetyl-ADP-ribose deacetylase (regulator of RNase III)